MKKVLFGGIIMVAVGFIIFTILNNYIYDQKQAYVGKDPQNAEYMIAGERVQLVDGESIREIENSSAFVVTKYFGNEATLDIDNDGREDKVFYLTQTTGGSGTFYYVAAALHIDSGYVGSEAVYIGDRIAPQSINIQKGNVVVNYADRNPGESFAVAPSFGKSIWLHYDVDSRTFGSFDPNFSGEADPSKMTLDMKTWNWIKTEYNNDEMVLPKKDGMFSVTFKENGEFSATTDCNSMFGTYALDGSRISFGPIAMTEKFCMDSQESEFAKAISNSQSYFFTSRGELVLEIKYDSGVVVFR